MKVKKLDLDLMPQIKKSDLRAKRRVLSRILEGAWARMVKGRGMEFAGFRKYSYGDDASMIDWNASLRAKETLVREFEEYKNINIFFMLDVSDSMLLTSSKKTKAEFGAELMFNIALSVMDNGEAVGFSMFADDIITKQAPDIGYDAVYRMVSELQKPANYGGVRNFERAVRIINDFLKQKSLIIIISDFLGLTEGWERYIRMISQKFDFIAIVVRDRRDAELPDLPVQVVVEDPFSKERIYIDAKEYKKAYAGVVKEQDDYLKSVIEKAKGGLLFVYTDKDPYAPLLSYFKKRQAIIKE